MAITRMAVSVRVAHQVARLAICKMDKPNALPVQALSPLTLTQDNALPLVIALQSTAQVLAHAHALAQPST